MVRCPPNPPNRHRCRHRFAVPVAITVTPTTSPITVAASLSPSPSRPSTPPSPRHLPYRRRRHRCLPLRYHCCFPLPVVMVVSLSIAAFTSPSHSSLRRRLPVVVAFTTSVGPAPLADSPSSLPLKPQRHPWRAPHQPNLLQSKCFMLYCKS